MKAPPTTKCPKCGALAKDIAYNRLGVWHWFQCWICEHSSKNYETLKDLRADRKWKP
jgi:hypothetical protein